MVAQVALNATKAADGMMRRKIKTWKDCHISHPLGIMIPRLPMAIQS